MTPRNKCLALQRLVILKRGEALYDESFKLGVNIIRGENSSGKSTIADFIFFALGGDLSTWTPEAGSADSVHAEVVVDDIVYTLSRDVVTSGHPPLFFYEGTYESAMRSRDSWLRYPYSRSSKTESFSQVLFGLIGLPEQTTDAQQNITMHQLLRLMYCDQLTPVNEIFRHEGFDSSDIRTAVSELLLGVDDLAMHDLRQKIRTLDRKYSEISGELKSLFQILGKTTDSDVTFSDLTQQFLELRTDRDLTSRKIAELSDSRDNNERKEASKHSIALAEQLRKVRRRIDAVSSQLQALIFEVEDSEQFIQTIEERISALDSSKKMAEIIGEVEFQSCPACLSPIGVRGPESNCHLCKEPLPEDGKWHGHLKMREELSFQLRESKGLLDYRHDEQAKLEAELSQLSVEKGRLSSDLEDFHRQIDPLDAEIATMQKRVGYLDRSMEDTQRKVELAKLVQERMDDRKSIGVELEDLKNKLVAFTSAREARWNQVASEIAGYCLDALHRDLPLEEAFQESEIVTFDFGRNRIWVDERSKFSASSVTYLKNAFLFALFRLSLVDDQTRWPRFILMDNIEDKGMQPERSANFQEYIVERSSEADVAHQVIMTTSMISPELENSDLCVGPHYDETQKSLAFLH